MLEEKKIIELDDENLEKVTGGAVIRDGDKAKDKKEKNQTKKSSLSEKMILKKDDVIHPFT